MQTVMVNDDFIFGTTYSNEIRIWDMAKLRLVARIAASKATLWAGPDASGKRLLSVDRAGTLTVQSLEPISESTMRDGTVDAMVDRIGPEIRRRAGFL
ncbi:MAG: hypothetical protein IPL79_17575 [Myxococcales bacterium]|nr:hypothetical protein [Myxococcales bacterium]